MSIYQKKPERIEVLHCRTERNSLTDDVDHVVSYRKVGEQGTRTLLLQHLVDDYSLVEETEESKCIARVDDAPEEDPRAIAERIYEQLRVSKRFEGFNSTPWDGIGFRWRDVFAAFVEALAARDQA